MALRSHLEKSLSSGRTIQAPLEQHHTPWRRAKWGNTSLELPGDGRAASKPLSQIEKR
ncbi:MAG: hypothetical protein AB7U73_03955 [Pirellulales bacterium]